MNVLLLANDLQKEELLSLPLHHTTRITWIKTEADICVDQPFDACIDLLFDDTAVRIEWLRNLQCPLIVINSVIVPLKDIQENFIRINAWKTFLKRPVIEAAVINLKLKAKAEELFLTFGRKTEWVADITGFITPRIIASIINEAFFALEEKVSSEEEIDIAMKSGTNYPYGPFEWGKQIGLQHIYSLLTALGKEQGRYQPSSLLKQTVLA
ncbi:MAG: 3-hydroxyacyl-CoA dehydrogenase family protein [Chitinophagaceae bacterium]